MLSLLQIPLRMGSCFHKWWKGTLSAIVQEQGEKSAFWVGGFSANVQEFHLGLWPELYTYYFILRKVLSTILEADLINET